MSENKKIDEKKSEEKKSIFRFLDKMGDGLMAMEGNPSSTVWENPYKKEQYEDLQQHEKSTHIVVSKPPPIPMVLISKKDK